MQAMRGIGSPIRSVLIRMYSLVCHIIVQFLIQADLFFPLYVIVVNAYKKIEDKIQEYNDASPGLIMEKCEGDPKLFDGYVMWLSYLLAEVLPPPFSSQVENQPFLTSLKNKQKTRRYCSCCQAQPRAALRHRVCTNSYVQHNLRTSSGSRSLFFFKKR